MEQAPPSAFGLVAIVESGRIVLPLKGVECGFSIQSGTATVSVTQIFRHENSKPLDCTYLFPLPADASAYACEANVNGRVIKAEVRERQEARRVAEQKKVEGFRVALVEAERENLFTLALSNVQPLDLIIVRLDYIQPLHRLGREFSLEIPLCPGIRYIPGKRLLRCNQGRGFEDDTDQVPDASKISPPRIDAGHPDAAYADIRGSLEGKFVEHKSLESPSHDIRVSRTSGAFSVSLADKGQVPDRNFVLRWRETNSAELAPRAWIQKKDKQQYALLEIRAPEHTKARRTAMDFYFLVDRSGSMEGAGKWPKAVEALKACVETLEPKDRAMITLFESSHQDFAEKPLPAREIIGDANFSQIESMGTGGGTELGPALDHVLRLASKHSASREKCLILITDAQVGNEDGILQIMRSAPDLPVHCFGIDIALNDQLLLQLAKQQGGTFHSLNPRDDIRRALTGLGEMLRSPVLLDLRLSGDWEIGDARIPNLYAGQVHYLSARGGTNRPISIEARDGAGRNVTIEFEQEAAGSAAPYLHWCKSRIQRFISEENDAEAIRLSTQANLICPLTAFIAWDESVKVVVASHELVQPALHLAETFQVRNMDFFMTSVDSLTNEFPLLPRQFPSMIRSLKAESPPTRIKEMETALNDICATVFRPDWTAICERILRHLAHGGRSQPEIRVAIEKLIKELKRAATEFKTRLSELRRWLEEAARVIEEPSEPLAAGTPSIAARLNALHRGIEARGRTLEDIQAAMEEKLQAFMKAHNIR